MAVSPTSLFGQETVSPTFFFSQVTVSPASLFGQVTISPTSLFGQVTVSPRLCLVGQVTIFRPPDVLSIFCWALHGALFSIMGAIFYYHAPITFLAVSPESPASPLGGGLQVAVQLDYESAGGLFGPTFDPEQTTVPAGCAFGDVEVPGEYLWASSQVTCVSPPVDRAAAVEMRVTLNGQIYSNDTIIYRYGFVGGIMGRTAKKGRRSLLEDYELALGEASKQGAQLALSGVPTEVIGFDPRLLGSTSAGESTPIPGMSPADAAAGGLLRTSTRPTLNRRTPPPLHTCMNGGVLRTSTRPTLNRRIESERGL